MFKQAQKALQSANSQIVALAALAVLLRVYHLGFQSLWFDEVTTLMFSSGDNLKELLARIATDVHPPLYYLSIHFWLQLFPATESGLRAFSAATSLASLGCFYLVAGALLSPQSRTVASLIAVTSLYQIWFAQEARSYGLISLLTLLYVLSYLEFITQPKFKSALVHSLLAALLLYTNYVRVFLFLPFAIHALVVWRQSASLQRPILFYGVISLVMALLLYLPWLVQAHASYNQVASNYWIGRPTLGDLFRLAPILLNYTGAFPELKAFAKVFAFCFFSLLALQSRFPVFALPMPVVNQVANKNDLPKRPVPAPKLLLYLWLIVPPLATYFVSLYGSHIFYFKPLIISSFALYLLLGDLITRLPRVNFQMALLALIIAFSGANYNWYYNAFHKEEWRNVTAYIEPKSAPVDQFIFDEPAGKLPFDHYYKQQYRSLTLGDLPQAERVWVIRSLSNKPLTQYKIQLREQGYRLRGAKPFAGVVVMLFNK